MDKLDSPERRGDSPESKQDSPERQTDRTHTEEHTQEENKNVTQEERKDDNKDDDKRESTESRRHREERRHDRDYDRRDSTEYRRHKDERRYERDYDRRDSTEYRRHKDERRYERDYDRRDSSEYRRHRDDYKDYDRRDSSEYRRHRDEYTSRGKRKYDDYGDDSRDDSDDQDINERTEVFEIKVSHEVQPDEFTLEHPDFQNVPSTDPARMSEAGYTTKESVEQLWKQKSRMDDVFDEGKSGAYYTSRDKIWPQDSKGSNRFRNRAGDKLLQVHRAMVADGILDIFEGVRGSLTFLDVCGGPGAFSQMLLVTGPMLSEPVIGYGITLKIEGADASLNWYNQLTSNENFNVLWGKDGTGNVYIPENLASVKTAIEEAGHSLDLVVADGGFGIKKVNGEHRENYQEVYSSRIVISEMLMCLMSLRDGGHFVCKLFDSLSHITQSIIYLCAQVFQECFVVKPERSRIVNSERYLVGKFLRREGQYKAKFDFLLGVLSELHARCTPGESPLSIIPISVMRDDTLFMETTQKMVVSLITKQTRALRIVMDETEKLVENGWRDHKKGRY
eukprot:TRINITY_DN443_c0_g1_i1.p1 TRINITY_DN443_c0_g1~~TRINITY_DN443_c0_g1_i1.p1  ORF type:complete len:564 (+),score=87.97 TRINITY_DN443_c0_g1_i1:10-1701(+)